MITPDAAVPEGKAVIDLHDELQLHARAGEWPGPDAVGILEQWLTRFDFGFPRAEYCAEMNSAAAFSATEGLPCGEVAGVLVFIYLDADMRAVRVSVHLDSANEELIRPDGTVPLHVMVGDSTVFSAGTASARTAAARWRVRLRWLTHRLPWWRGIDTPTKPTII